MISHLGRNECSVRFDEALRLCIGSRDIIIKLDVVLMAKVGSHWRSLLPIGSCRCAPPARSLQGREPRQCRHKTSNSQPAIRTHHEPPIWQAKANAQAPIEQEVQPLMINPVNHMHCPERVFLNCPESTLINYVMSV